MKYNNNIIKTLYSFVAVATALVVPVLRGADLGTKDVRVELRLNQPSVGDKQYRVKLPNGQERTLSNSESLPLRLKKNEVPRFWVMDPNVFLLKYAHKEGTPEATDSYQAWTKWSEGLAKAFKPASVDRVMGSPDASVLDRYVKLQATIKGADYDLREILPAGTVLARIAMVDIPKFLEKTRTAPFASTEFRTPEALQGTESLIQFLDALHSLPLSGDGTVTLAMEILTPTKDDPKKTEKHSLKSTSAQGLFRQIEAISTDELALTDRLRALVEVRGELKEMAKFVKGFADDQAKATRVKAEGLFLAESSVDLKNKKPQIITVTANPAYSSISSIKDFQDKNAREVTLTLEPHEPFHFRGGLGVIYSFVENPKFEVKTDAAGKMTVAKTSSETNEFGGAAMLNVYPDYFWGSNAEPFVQVGYSLAKDSSGFLVGVGLSGYRELNVSAGFIYQQARELGNGLKEGAELAKAEDLVVRNPYKGGIYVQIGFQF